MTVPPVSEHAKHACSLLFLKLSSQVLVSTDSLQSTTSRKEVCFGACFSGAGPCTKRGTRGASTAAGGGRDGTGTWPGGAPALRTEREDDSVCGASANELSLLEELTTELTLRQRVLDHVQENPTPPPATLYVRSYAKLHVQTEDQIGFALDAGTIKSAKSDMPNSGVKLVPGMRACELQVG